jgi:hypothetical protein
MKIIYIAHPISGDVKGNLERVRQIAQDITLKFDDVVAFAPYWFDCHFLDDNNPVERERGIRNDHEFFERSTIDEVWLYGDRISKGMEAEIKLAISCGIIVVPMSTGTKAAYRRTLKEVYGV